MKRLDKPISFNTITRFWFIPGVLLFALLGAVLTARGAEPDPGQAGPCPVASRSETIAGNATTIYYPDTNACSGGPQAPYPGIAFAHGFSSFGFSQGATENAGNGEHLASWGYVVAIPNLPDAAEERITGLTGVLDYLAAQASTQGAFFYGKVDSGRLATAGYSLGGATALAVAGRDARVKAVVALDPVYHEGTFSGEGAEIWDPHADAPNISIPAGILGSPPSSCNAQSDYTDIFPLVGATHKSAFLLANGTHCDFPDPGGQFCGLTCGDADAGRRTLSQKYMTAWLNYYLQYRTGYYDYLYGAQADQDRSAGKISDLVDTAPHGLAGSASTGGVELNWQVYAHPEISGYRLFRRLTGENYPATPYVQLGVIGAFTDTNVQAGQTYFYFLKSYDPAGNEHAASSEVGFQVPGVEPGQPTPTPRPSPTPGLPKVRVFMPYIHLSATP